MGRRSRQLLLALVAASFLVAAAWAYWASSGTGSGSGSVATLDPAAISVPSTSTGSHAVTWTQQAALTGSPPDESEITYTVERKLGSGSFEEITSGGCDGPLAHGTTSCTDTVAANGDYTYRVVAKFRSWTATSAAAGPVAATVNTDPAPEVDSIVRADTSPTNAASVGFTVTFSESVTGVDTTDFVTAATGVSGTSVASVTGTGDTYTVTVDTGSDSGTLGLNLADDDSIQDSFGNNLGGSGTGNGDFTGQVYTIDKDAPTITASAKNADNSTYTAGTWTKQTVTVHYTCSDPTVNGVSSGLASCPSDQVFSSDTDTTASGTATDNAGNSASTNFAVKVDKTAPANSLSLVDQSTQSGPAGTTNPTSFLMGNTLWYAGGVAGSFKLQNALTDSLSGPASSSYAALAGTSSGWSFTGSTVTTPSGGPYVSNQLSWAVGTASQPTEDVTGADAAGNTSTATTTTFKHDSASPSDSITFPVAGNYTGPAWDASPCVTATICGTTTDAGNSPAFGSSSSAANASGGATTLVLNKPTSVATNDVLIAAVTVSAGTSAITSVPSGWTQIRAANQGSNVAIVSYYHVVTNAASEPASYSWGLTSGTRASGGISRYTGVDTSNPIDVSGAASGNNSASVQAPSVTTTADNDLVVGLFSVNANTNFTPPSGTTERYDVTNTNSGGPAVESADFTQVSAGSTGTKTATAGTSGSWAAQHIALKPAPSNGSNTSGLAKVQVSIQATSGASSGKYWDPAANGGTGGFTSSSEVLMLASGTTNWSLAFPSTNLTDAGYTVRAYAVDNVGNYTATPASRSFTIDNTPPTTTDNTASIGSAWRNTSATVTLTPSDTGSGVAATYYTTDGSTPTTSSPQGTSISLTNTGIYTIKYFSVDNAGNQETLKTASTQIRIDKAAPTSSLALGSATGAHLSGTTLYYKGNASGSFTFANTLTDPDSGPASTTFPAIATTGWTHNAETVSGASPYTSSAYSWTASPSNPSSKTITSTDVAGNTSTRSISFTSDTTGPTGGAVTVNSTAASAAGSTSVNTSGSFSITTLTQYSADSGSGAASSSLVRDEAALNADGTGTCSNTWTNPTTISGATPISQIGTTGTCYRYTLTGTDNVGNSASISTVVKVDTTGPTTPTLSITANGSRAYADGTTVYYNGTTGTSSSFTVSATTSDPDSGIQKVNFPTLTSFTGGGDKTSSPYSSTYTWTSSSDSGSKTVTAYNGLGSTTAGTFSLVRDVSAPTGGALTVNGVAASSGGSTSTASTDSFAIDARTNYDEAQSSSQSGLASSTLTIQSETLSSSGTCGAPGSGGPFTSPTTISGTTQPSGIVAGFCYLYTLTGTDNVGNADSVKTTVVVTDAFQVSDPGTRTAGTAFNLTITAIFNGATDTSYTGSKTVTFTGPGTSPGGTAPSYPASVSFVNGVGTPSITLYKAETTALTATQGAITGTSPSFTVNAGSAARIAWTGISTNSPGTPSPNPCYFTCTYSSGFGNSNSWSANASITDSLGNVVSGVGSGHNVTVTLGGSKNGRINGGTSAVTLTMPATGAATSTNQLAYVAGAGPSWTDTLTAASSGFTSASASFSK